MPNKQKPISIQSQNEEYEQVRRDLIKVLVLNGVLFIIMLGFFFWNRSTGVLDQFFGKFLKF